MSYSENSSFEMKLAYHTAPSLLGIKCASLVSFRADEFDLACQAEKFNEKAKVKGLKIKLLCGCKGRMLILLYNEKLLTKHISDKYSREILKKYGYNDETDIENDLARLSERIRSEQEFPHEIGVFLDYPAEDVKGFIENKGGNFKFCGCWKVYGDEEKAKRTFINYEKCRNFLCNKLNSGDDIYRALKIS